MPPIEENKSLRPSQSAERFLATYLERHAPADGERLPSTRAIANELGISEGTVRNVVRKWQRAGKLESRHGSGIYFRQSSPANSAKNHPFLIGANMRDAQIVEKDSDFWTAGIINGMLRTLVRFGPKVFLGSLYSEYEVIDDLPDAEIDHRCRQFHGMILMISDPHYPAIVEHCRRQRKPFVTLNAYRPGTSANFVSTQTTSSYDRMARALVASGRQRLALFVYPSVRASESTAQRLAGVARGISDELGRSVQLRVVNCDTEREQDGREALRRLLDDEGYRPDALIFSGDPHAIGALELLRERGISVPGEMSVISGAGVDPRVHQLGLTSFLHPVREIGVHLATLLVQMLETQTLETPGVYLPVGIVEGSSTTVAESQRIRENFADLPQISSSASGSQ